MRDINIKSEKLHPYKDIEKQIGAQTLMRFNKKEDGTLLYCTKIGLCVLLGVAVASMFIGSIGMLFNSNFISSLFNIKLLPYTALQVLVTNMTMFTWMSTIAFGVFGISNLLEKIYSIKFNLFSTIAGVILTTCGSAGLSTGVFWILTSVIGMQFSGNIAAIWAFGSLFTFITLLSFVLLYFKDFFFTLNPNDLDKGEFKLTSDGPAPDLDIDLLSPSGKGPRVNVIGEKPSDHKLNVADGQEPDANLIKKEDKQIYQGEANALIRRRNYVKIHFSDVMAFWAATMTFPLGFLLFIFAPTSGAQLIEMMSGLGGWFLNASGLKQFLFVMSIGAMNWIFSVFVRLSSLAFGSILGYYQNKNQSTWSNVVEGVSSQAENVVFTGFKESIFVSVLSALYSSFFFLTSLFKRRVTTGDKINFASSLVCLLISTFTMFFSGFLSFFDAFKYIKIGMYPSELIKVADMSVYDNNWKSYLTTCLIMLTLVAILLLVAWAAFTLWGGVNPIAMKFAIPKKFGILSDLSMRVYILGLYSLFMLSFVIIPTIVEVMKGRPDVAKDLIFYKLLTPSIAT
ncbi:hypothetical protein NEAUS03_0919 [Nematocida ausubeli]|nr:hypothetical protein NEAUS03_0919 [Nematocida ausubeli]